MKHFILFIIIGLFAFFASAEQVYRHSSMFRDVQWKISTVNHNYVDQSENQVLLITKLYGLLNHSFLPTVDFSMEYILNTSQGASQSVHVRRKSSDQIRQSHMYLSLRPLAPEPLFLRMGLFNQKFLDAPLLISDWTFLGLQQEYILHDEKIMSYVDSLKVVLQQTIPSSSTGLDYLEQVQDIGRFYTASLLTSSFIQNQVQTEGRLTAFYFKNLSAAAADYGSVYGNETHPDYTGADSEFLYPDFYGLYMRGNARYNLFPELGLELDASFLWNMGATAGVYQRIASGEGENLQGRALGYNMWLGLHIPIAKEVIMLVNLEYFDNDRNASPAFYNSDRYRHSGRYGVIIGLKSIFEKYNVFFDVQYAIIRSHKDVKALIGNPNYLMFEIGTEYDKI